MSNKRLTLKVSSNRISLNQLQHGDLFLWDDLVCFFLSGKVQYIIGPGEKVSLNADTEVQPISPYEFEIDGVRQWVRRGVKLSSPRAKKAITPLESLVLMNEQNAR